MCIHIMHAVGGIYTVIRTKAQVTTAELGDQYCMIGPYNEACVRLEVEVMEPELSVLKEVITSLRSQGFKVRVVCVIIVCKCGWCVIVVSVCSCGWCV